MGKAIIFLLLSAFVGNSAFGQKDTLRVMAYNVLYYGNGCQGPSENYHAYLKTIIGYTNPDIISLEKMASIPVSSGDKFATAPVGFADSVLKLALNAAYSSRYAYCPFTNNARANNTAVLFYDQSKLGFAGLVSSYVNVTDFNTYKLYYKDPNLSATHDTTFLYITPNHDKSGDEFEEVRALQITGELNGIKHHFSKLANHIVLGDFNVRSSAEGCYQAITANEDSNFRFFDPPFFPDKVFKYPANWDHDGNFRLCFTTSTRESASVPNNCGSGGGGKNWYDHIFLSPWLVNEANYMRYIPKSYRTIGNDGQRFRVSIINKNSHTNTSAPADVINALYQMSNKYPVMVDLEVSQNSNGKSPADPEITFATIVERDEITVANSENIKTGSPIVIYFPEAMMGQEISIECVNKEGESQLKKKLTLKDKELTLQNKLTPGTYTLKFSGKHNLISETGIVIE